MNIDNRYPNTIIFLEEVGETQTDIMMETLKANNKYATGELYNSIDFDIEETDNDIGLVIEYAKQGDFVISGRRPGAYPNINAIRNWIIDKKLKSKDISLESQTYLIARSIKENGIKALNFISEYEKYIQSEKFLNDLTNNLALDLEEYIKNNEKQ